MFEKWGLQSTATEPGAYDAQTRSFAVGGRLAVRSQTEMIQPFSFKAPYIKAGCEGIDIFAGAFSWINADQLIETLKAVGQNAIGYAFHLGLETVCPVCVSTLKGLMNFMNQINNMSMDTCTAAKTLVNGGIMAALDAPIEGCKSNPEAGWTDKISGWINCAGQAEPQVKAQLRGMFGTVAPWTQENPPKQQTTGIDITRKALEGKSLSTEEKQYALSVIGTSNYENVEDDDGGFFAKCVPYKPTLTLTELINGGVVKMWDCAPGKGSMADGQQCQQYIKVDKLIVGFREHAKQQLIGIYNTLRGPASSRILTTEQKTFIDRSKSVQVYLAMNSLAQMGPGNEPAAMAAIDMYAQTLGVDYAWGLIDLYMEMASSGAHNSSNGCAIEQETLKTILTDLRGQRSAELAKVVAELESYQIMSNFTDNINKVLSANTKKMVTSFAPRK